MIEQTAEQGRGDVPTNPGQRVGLLSTTSLTQLVNSAFRNYQSTLTLSRSALANSALVTPTLVLDDASPTAEERGRGLRLVLRWAVEQIVPAPATYPLGEFRPFDDPTWSDPLWWRYNILRHRYVEPLHPDDFIGGRYTETLMALTGISSSDAFFDERNRAIQDVAERLRQQLIDGAGNKILQQMALREAVRPLSSDPEAARLLGIAATFDDVFPRSLLMTMAAEEQIRQADHVLDYLIANRLLLVGDGQRSLWLSPTVRAHIYQQQAAEQRQRRHRRAARYYRDQDQPLITATHWQHAGRHDRAATVLFNAADGLINELQVDELLKVLEQFQEPVLEQSTWRELQILRSDLYYRAGRPEDALAACRRALKAAADPVDQARAYRRMGKLYEQRNQLHALTYYQQAAERFDPMNLELADLLKDRGWLHILRHNWADAETDLQHALMITQASNLERKADIFDALASLYRRQKQYSQALQYAQQALSIRESEGNIPRVASSFNNLGTIYRHLGEYWHAISAYEEALDTYRKLGNQESIAGALLNIGNAYFLLDKLGDAIDNYQQSLALCIQLGQHHIEATAHYNLAEAYAARQQQTEAQEHWHRGYDLSQRAGFADEVQAFEQLRSDTPLLQLVPDQLPQKAAHQTQHTISNNTPPLPPDEQAVLDLADTYGQLTAKLLITELNISRATATRRLRTLTEAGHLVQHGKGRGIYYTRSTDSAAVPESNVMSNDVESTGMGLSTATLATLLATHETTLTERFGVTAISPMTEHHIRPTYPLKVSFETVPTLSEFWALRQYLAQVVGSDVDLQPTL